MDELAQPVDVYDYDLNEIEVEADLADVAGDAEIELFFKHKGEVIGDDTDETETAEAPAKKKSAKKSARVVPGSRSLKPLIDLRVKRAPADDDAEDNDSEGDDFVEGFPGAEAAEDAGEGEETTEKKPRRTLRPGKEKKRAVNEAREAREAAEPRRDWRAKRPFGEKSFGDRPPRTGGRSFGGGGGRSFNRDRSEGSEGSSEGGDRPRRSFGKKSFGKKPFGGSGRSFGGGGGRSFNRDRSEGSEGSSEGGDRPRRSFGKKSFGKKPFGGGGRSFGGGGGRSFNRDRSEGDAGSSEGGDRPRRSFGKKSFARNHSVAAVVAVVPSIEIAAPAIPHHPRVEIVQHASHLVARLAVVSARSPAALGKSPVDLARNPAAVVNRLAKSPAEQANHVAAAAGSRVNRVIGKYKTQMHADKSCR